MMDQLKSIFFWIQYNIPPWVYITLVVHGVVLGAVAYLILLERKVASWAQDRIGPNRVGLGFGLPFIPKWNWIQKANGFGQPLADGLKFIVKEDYAPKGTDVVLFTVAPMIMIIVIIVSIATIPWGGTKQSNVQTTTIGRADWRGAVPVWAVDSAHDKATRVPGTRVRTFSHDITYSYPFQIADLNIGVLFILAALSLAVYGVVIGGWASNNKYSFLGGLRACVNMISYEIPLGLAVLCLVLMYGSLNLGTIVEAQCHNWWGIIPAWNCFSQPLPFIMFLICIHAEANRAPFDLAEAEQELVGGYHTEYSSMRFALFFLAEYAGMITTSAICVALFLGGWDFFGLRGADAAHPAITTSLVICIIRSLVFFAKTIFIIFVFMWVRWSLPRFRFDQLMMLAWRALIPISLALLMMTAVIIYYSNGASSSTGVDGAMALELLGANVVTLAVIMFISTLLPPAPLTNRRVVVSDSRFNKPALPKPVALNR
jgi:NADH-quinone oxidoreductase subunit H